MDETVTGSVLVVDDEAGMRHILNKLFSSEGYTVFTAESAHEALELAQNDHPDIAFLDIRIPDMNGLELLTALKGQDPDLVVIMMTAFGTVETAVQAIKSGAYEYITKPFENDKILVMASNAIERRRLIDRTRRLTEEVQDRRSFEGLIGRSKSLQELTR
ncbi:MAG TPA: response regulator [bacterium]|nr:response regulator [bacterium]